MHNCRKTQEQMVDLLFQELAQDQARTLLEEIKRCAECLSEHVTMKETLRAFDRASEFIEPTESYWQAYHQTLADKLAAAAATEGRVPVSVPFWKRIMTARIPVPVPVAAGLVLFVLGASLYAAMRSSSSARQLAPAQSSASTAPQIRIIEVPLVQERIVTQTVYVEKNRQQNRAGEPAQTRPAAQQAIAGSAAPAQKEKENAASPHADLADFKPAPEVKLTLIKGNYQDEK